MEKKIGDVYFTKKMFIEVLGEMKKQHLHDEKCSKAFKVILPNDYISGYQNKLTSCIIKTLEVAFDDCENQWIEYYVFELSFGTKYKDGCVTDFDGSNIDISNSGKLWDFLTKKIKDENKQ